MGPSGVEWTESSVLIRGRHSPGLNSRMDLKSAISLHQALAIGRTISRRQVCAALTHQGRYLLDSALSPRERKWRPCPSRQRLKDHQSAEGESNGVARGLPYDKWMFMRACEWSYGRRRFGRASDGISGRSPDKSGSCRKSFDAALVTLSSYH